MLALPIDASARMPGLVAANDIYGLLFAVSHGNRYGLRGAARDIWSHHRLRRPDGIRIPMDRIPRNVIRVRVVNIG